MKKTAVIFSLVLAVGCSDNQNEQSRGDFAHTVYFWLKTPNNQEHRDTFEKSLKYFLNNSEFVKTKHIGVPAATNREVIDNSYTYSLLVTFKNKEDHDAYQIESNHKKFIKEASHLWEKVVVYDSQSILP